MVNSLAQIVLKLASPGVPDLYQGNELWDLSLVDPDNRRDVDFASRRRMLDELLPLILSIEGGGTGGGGAAYRDLLEHWEDGRIKLLVTAIGLRFRRRHAQVVLDGAYVPLQPEGEAADSLVAFARRHASGTLLAAVPRLAGALTQDGQRLPLGEPAWASTRIPLPGLLPAARYRHLMTGETIEAAREPDRSVVLARDVFCTSPVALLWAPSRE
jgi:(1->4)-alpha-D-glucan 1-alpha-D-glucosylmutase